MTSRWNAAGRKGTSIWRVPSCFSVLMNPLRDGGNFGSRVGAIAKCPKGKLPDAGKNCDSVEGVELLGGTTF